VNEEHDARPNTKRCFVAIPAPEDICQRAAEIQQFLRKKAGLKGIRWLKTDGLHITLKFLGNVPVEDLTYLAQQLSIVSQGCRDLESFGGDPTGKTSRPSSVRFISTYRSPSICWGSRKRIAPFTPTSPLAA
jgi:hypothetical protein